LLGVAANSERMLLPGALLPHGSRGACGQHSAPKIHGVNDSTEFQ